MAQKNYAEIKQARAELREYNKTLPKEKEVKPRAVFGVLGVVVPFILTIILARTFTDVDFTFSFFDLLEELRSIPVFDVTLFDEVLNAFTIDADWGAFNGLRDFLNSFGQILGFLQFLGLLLYNALSYVLSFVRILFGF